MKNPIFSCIIVNAKMPYKAFVSTNPNIVVGTKRNRLNETVLLSSQNKYLN